MMKKTSFIFIIVLLASQLKAQKIDDHLHEKVARVAFYNVENLFHPLNDSLVNDDEFTENGSKNWNYFRYRKKLINIYKVLIAMGRKQPPAIIGLCEVENVWTVKDLIEKTPLSAFNYKFIHKESPDERGIDVAFLYDQQVFEPFYYNPIALILEAGNTTRDILHVKGIVHDSDTFHFFINHWPSRWGGQLATEPYRVRAAQTLKQTTDSILNVNPAANILVIGDLNDTPNNKSIQYLTSAKDSSAETSLINLMQKSFYKGEGTITTTSPFTQWHLFDQIICSRSAGSKIKNAQAYIFKPEWLLDAKRRPWRTYQGPAYKGGFSDHLPVYVDILSK